MRTFKESLLWPQFKHVRNAQRRYGQKIVHRERKCLQRITEKRSKRQQQQQQQQTKKKEKILKISCTKRKLHKLSIRQCKHWRVNSKHSKCTHTIESKPIKTTVSYDLYSLVWVFQQPIHAKRWNFRILNEHFFFFRFRFGSGELIDVCMYFFSCVPLIVAQFSISRTPAHSYIASEILTFRMITLSFCQLLILFFSLWINLVRTSFLRSFVRLCTMVYVRPKYGGVTLAYSIQLFRAQSAQFTSTYAMQTMT